MAGAPFDQAKAHKWFAIEFNNNAWDLIEQDVRSMADAQKLIHLAHASAYHWSQAGNELNVMRAENLVAMAYVTVGLAEPALRHATRCVEMCAELADSASPWDKACAYGCLSRAYAIAGRLDDARAEYDKATPYVDQFEHEDEPAVFAKMCPKP